LAAGSLPGFKPATAEEIARRYQAADPDPESRYYAVEGGEVVGYAAFGSNGRISYPWSLPEADAVRGPLFERVLGAMRKRGLHEAWAAYRADWLPVLEFLRQRGFVERRVMINYVADLTRLPSLDRLPANRVVAQLKRAELPQLIALSPVLFFGTDARALERFFWDNPFHDFSQTLFALKERDTDKILGGCLLVVNNRFADPTKIDAAMPCFRLGAFGTEGERHKRVNGLFSCVFADEAEGEPLLSAVIVPQAIRAGLTHLATQAPSDALALCAFYDRFFQRQGSFPILSRRLLT
jgi:hypothetical protein